MDEVDVTQPQTGPIRAWCFVALVNPDMTLGVGTFPLLEVSARFQGGYVIGTCIVLGFGVQAGLRYLDK